MASVSCVLLVASAATASSLPNTPLYTVRMEQASSKMNFLQTNMNGFTYTAENGCIVNYNAAGYCGAPLEITVGKTCDGTCVGEETCPYTCYSTCPSTCDGYTCDDTSCQATCNTCTHTCGTCAPEDTCINTCFGGYTCFVTCLICK